MGMSEQFKQFLNKLNDKLLYVIFTIMFAYFSFMGVKQFTMAEDISSIKENQKTAIKVEKAVTTIQTDLSLIRVDMEKLRQCDKQLNNMFETHFNYYHDTKPHRIPLGRPYPEDNTSDLRPE